MTTRSDAKFPWSELPLEIRQNIIDKVIVSMVWDDQESLVRHMWYKLRFNNRFNTIVSTFSQAEYVYALRRMRQRLNFFAALIRSRKSFIPSIWRYDIRGNPVFITEEERQTLRQSAAAARRVLQESGYRGEEIAWPLGKIAEHLDGIDSRKWNAEDAEAVES